MGCVQSTQGNMTRSQAEADIAGVIKSSEDRKQIDMDKKNVSMTEPEANATSSIAETALIAGKDYIEAMISWKQACEFISNQEFSKFNRSKENCLGYQTYRKNVVSKYVSGRDEVLHTEFSYI